MMAEDYSGLEGFSGAGSFEIVSQPRKGGGRSTGSGGGPAVVTDPYFSFTKLLLGFEGTNGATGAPGMTDESSAAHGTATIGGNAQIDTAQFKFGTSSLLCDGTGDGITFPDSDDWTLSSANSDQFTVEGWAIPNTTTPTNKRILAHDNGAGGISWTLATDASNQLLFAGSTNALTFNWSVNPTSVGLTWAVGTKYFVAADKDATGKVRVYRDGVMVASGTPSSSVLINSTALFSVGSSSSGFGNSWNGWIDEVRITKGVARYASNSGFTPPTAAFPRS